MNRHERTFLQVTQQDADYPQRQVEISREVRDRGGQPAEAEHRDVLRIQGRRIHTAPRAPP